MKNKQHIYYFSPDLKTENYLLEELRESIKHKGQIDFLSKIINGPYSDESKFCFSLLNDILNIGGVCWTVNERVFVKWPDWSGERGRLTTKFALERSIDKDDPFMKNLKRNIWDSHKEFFFDIVERDELLKIVNESSFELKLVEESESTIFDICLKYWTMPVRSRPSRSKKFILWCLNSKFLHGRKVVGIVEIGDDAPVSNLRDEMLGLTHSSFIKWFKTGSIEEQRTRSSKIHDRFCKLRDSLRSDDPFTISDSLSGKKLKHYRTKIEKAVGFFDPNIHNGDVNHINSESSTRDLKESIKILHDIILPRIHCEVTICGSIPPFNEILGGKLMISFLGHYKIQSALKSSESKILQMSFDLKKLNKILPNYGSLGITTKGLYSGHSPMYKNSIIAGLNAQIKFRHLGNTSGLTTSFISSKTVTLAKKLLRLRNNELSTTWGSGGSLKQRILTRSCSAIGLDQCLPFAGINRPVYGCCYVSNIHEIIWCNESPRWTYNIEETMVNYSVHYHDLWSKKWLCKIIRKPSRKLGSIHQFIEHRISEID